MQPRLFASRCVRVLAEVVPRWTGLQHEGDVVAGSLVAGGSGSNGTELGHLKLCGELN